MRASSPAVDSSPLYLQLARQLATDIQRGIYRTDQALPSERFLSETLGVSRVTARKAIDVLVEQGLVLRKHGSGNFIPPRLEQASSKLASFSDELRQRGYTPSSQWITREVAVASALESEVLCLPRASRLTRLVRLRLADGVPMALEHSALPVQVLPQPTALEGSLYEYLDAHGAAPVRAQQLVRAINATGDMAKHLLVPESTALLWVRRVAYDMRDRAVEFTQSYCRSDYYSLAAELKKYP